MRLSPDKYAEAAHRLLESIDACFVHYFWKTQIRPHLPALAGMHKAIIGCDNASVQATLVSLRRINDFFASAGNRKDDLNAKDFPFLPSMSGFISESQKGYISKHMAHFTHLHIAEPEHPFPYRLYLKAMIPTALRVCAAFRAWGQDAHDVTLACHAEECASVCESVFEKYANLED